MKLTKTAAGKTGIQISRQEWHAIGRKAGWMKKVAWGYPAPEEPKPLRYWGARAIFERGVIDILGDRSNYNGPEQDDPKEKKAFFDWGNTAIKKLRKLVANLGGDSRTVIPIDEAHYHLRASPNASYGYLYIGIWEDDLSEDSRMFPGERTEEAPANVKPSAPEPEKVNLPPKLPPPPNR